MIESLTKLTLRLCFFGLIWLFIFSIQLGSRTVFDIAHSNIVQSSLVQTTLVEIDKIWFKVRETAVLTYSSLTEKNQNNSEKM